MDRLLDANSMAEFARFTAFQSFFNQQRAANVGVSGVVEQRPDNVGRERHAAFARESLTTIGNSNSEFLNSPVQFGSNHTSVRHGHNAPSNSLVGESSRRIVSPDANVHGQPISGPATASAVEELQRLRASLSIPSTSICERRRTTYASPRQWRANVFFLGDNSEAVIPDPNRAQDLTSEGLGDAIAYSPMTGSLEVFRDSIRSSFLLQVLPTLRNYLPIPADEIFFDVSYGVGSGSNELISIEGIQDIPGIRALNVRTFYARPSVTIYGLANTTFEDDSELSGASSSTLSMSSDFDELEVPLTDLTTYNEFKEQVRRTYGGHQDVRICQPPDVLPTELMRFEFEITPYKKPQFRIEGGQGFDAGGITRAYISKLMAGLSEKSFEHNGIVANLFDGPSTSLTLAEDEIFLHAHALKALSNFMNFSYLNTGIAYVGLSRFLVKFLLSSDDNADVNMTEEDIPDADVRGAYVALKESITTLEFPCENIVQTCLEWFGWKRSITAINANEALEHMKKTCVFSCRQKQLKALRTEFQQSLVGKWLQLHPEFMETAFPIYIETSVDDFMNAFYMSVGNAGALLKLRNFADQHVRSNKKLSEIIDCLTGFPTLLGSKLDLFEEDEEDSIENENNRHFSVSTCSGTLTVFPTYDQSHFNREMNILLEAAKFGFTDI